MSEKRDSSLPKNYPQPFAASLFLLYGSLSVYAKKWIIVLIVNKLNFICFTWFVYTVVNYKCNVFLKRDDVCLIPRSTLVTLSRFDARKEIRIVCSKMVQKFNAKCCGDVAATLWQRLDNVGKRCLFYLVYFKDFLERIFS